ncbi:hypothetical protein HGRIS_006866 [Hohenbuehelia grisea]|uniref:Uncharacterized protein n=1 Tax=Hohenbuehelia grisea TaxID=104357 RepID=A0ABR3JBU7_9AGAR
MSIRQERSLRYDSVRLEYAVSWSSIYKVPGTSVQVQTFAGGKNIGPSHYDCKGDADWQR